ncbi:Thyroid adenoma-associated, partial [Brachionus plicatilis]
QANLFYENEIEKSFKINWQSNSKLNALILLVENGCNIETISKLNQDLPADLIDSITERSSACLVADLYSKLFKAFRENSCDLDHWASQWWKPVFNCLESDNKIRKSYIYEYLLLRVMKLYPDGIHYCQKLSKNFSTIISCTKVTRTLGHLNMNSAGKNLFGNLDAVILEKALVHNDQQTRLDSLALLCENPKTTEPIQEIEFELIKKFLYFNSDVQSASYRQTVNTSMKRLFFRFKDSWLSVCRLDFRSKNNSAQSNGQFPKLNELYKNFIQWLFDFIFDSIHLDSTFAKRNQNLLLFSLFIEIIGTRLTDANNNQSEICFDFQRIFDRKRLLTLIECLWDTYTINKNLVLDLLIKIESQIFDQYGFSMEDYFRVAIRLLSSRKPIDSMTSVYLMLFVQSKTNVSSIDTLSRISPKTCYSKTVNMFLAQSVLDEFKIHCKTATQNLLLAALQKPVYGPLAAIRNLLTQSIKE